MHILTINEITELFLNKISKNFYRISTTVLNEFEYNIVIYRRYLLKDRDGKIVFLDSAYWTNNNKKVLDSSTCPDEEMFIILRKIIQKKY